jgi:hypothetical protein
MWSITQPKNEIVAFTGKWMELEITKLSGTSQTEENKYHLLSHMQSLVFENE